MVVPYTAKPRWRKLAGLNCVWAPALRNVSQRAGQRKPRPSRSPTGVPEYLLLERNHREAIAKNSQQFLAALRTDRTMEECRPDFRRTGEMCSAGVEQSRGSGFVRRKLSRSRHEKSSKRDHPARVSKHTARSVSSIASNSAVETFRDTAKDSGQRPTCEELRARQRIGAEAAYADSRSSPITHFVR